MAVAKNRVKPKEIKQLQDSIADKRTALNKAEDDLKALQVRHKDKEGELATREDAIKKLQTQLYQLKTNKEYSTMLHEIESKKADKSLLEEEIIKLMDVIDEANRKVSDEKVGFEQEKVKVEQQVKVLESRIKEIDAKLQELQKSRGSITPDVDHNLLLDYEKVLVGRNGDALVEVVNDACGGCYMNLPPQVINEIKKKDRIIVCESCQRMLFIKE